VHLKHLRRNKKKGKKKAIAEELKELHPITTQYPVYHHGMGNSLGSFNDVRVILAYKLH